MFRSLLNYTYVWAPALIVFVVYCFTLAPTISPEDGGEFAAAAYTFGIPHPSGYPLWTLSAGVFVALFGWLAEPAWLANLFSAILGASTVALVSILARQLGATRFAAAVGALVLGFSLEFWEQSVIAEVYTLNALLCVLIVLLLTTWARTGATPLLWLACAMFGLGLGNHPSLLLLAPPLLLYAFAGPGRRYLSVRNVIVGVASTVLACVAIHMYLPLSALGHPPLNWGEPDNWARFWAVVSRAQFQDMVSEGPRSIGLFFRQFGVFLGAWAVQFTPWIFIFVFLGLWTGVRRQRAETVLLVGCVAVIALGAILIPNFSLERQWIWLNTTYWIPVYVFSAVLIALGLSVLPAWWASAVMAVLAVASPLAMHWQHNDMRDYYFSRDYGENLLRTMRPDAVYFGAGDHTIFPMIYLQIVEGEREDVLLANPYGYPPASVYADMDEAFRQQYADQPHAVDEDAVWDWWLRHSERPMYSPVRRPAGPRRVVHEGLLYAYLPRSAHEESRPWESFDYQWHTLDPKAAGDDWFARNILYEVYLARGRDAFERDEDSSALNYVGIASKLLSEDPDALNNLGALCAAYRAYEPAINYLQRAIALRPEMREAHLNAALALRIVGKRDEAAELLDDWLIRHPDDEEAAEQLQKTRRENGNLTPGGNSDLP